MEVKYIWKAKKWQLSTILYVCCRYALVANVLYLLDIAQKLSSRVGFCDVWYKIIGALSVFGRAAVIITLTARTFAIFDRDRFILAYFLLLGTFCIALDISHVPGLKCVGGHSNPVVNEMLSIAMVVFEFSAAILMIIRCVQSFKVGGPWKKQKRGFVYLVFEQGILYFCIVSVFSMAAVILNFRAPAGFFQRLLNAFTLPLSGLLTARFLLHIRKWSYKRSRMPPSLSAPNGRSPQNSHSQGTLSTIIEGFGEDPVQSARSFNRTVGSVESPLSPGYERFLLQEVGKGTAMISNSASRSDTAAVVAASSMGSRSGGADEVEESQRRRSHEIV
ncbi:hypothetical protein L218DRAFT_938340 [Marasmius fiardii PR-910]|nr:hypothetical protein L218DRAFT_938340 [Marasmius fiardii PR-910]